MMLTKEKVFQLFKLSSLKMSIRLGIIQPHLATLAENLGVSRSTQLVQVIMLQKFLLTKYIHTSSISATSLI